MATKIQSRKWNCFYNKIPQMSMGSCDNTQNQVLLTIAIPTYNRSKVLDIALQRLLPQIEKHSTNIELVISDNASIDNTQEIIEKHYNIYTNLIIKKNRQPYNTGFFGNFKKCRELSTGKYLWLLSDNDHIINGAIDFLMGQIISGVDVAAFYFSNENDENKYTMETSNIEDFFLSEKAFFITLISSVVLLNDKTNDSIVFEKYPGNSFLGFLYLCNSFIINKRISTIRGKTFEPANSYSSWDVFNSWTRDISDCIEYMIDNKILNIKTKELFISGYLKNNTATHVYLYLMKKKYNGINHYKPIELKLLLDKYYSDYQIYNSNVKPLFYRKRISLYFEYILKKIKRKYTKVLSGK